MKLLEFNNTYSINGIREGVVKLASACNVDLQVESLSLQKFLHCLTIPKSDPGCLN